MRFRKCAAELAGCVGTEHIRAIEYCAPSWRRGARHGRFDAQFLPSHYATLLWGPANPSRTSDRSGTTWTGGSTTKSSHVVAICGLVIALLMVQVTLGGPTGPVGGARAAAAPPPTLSIGFLQTVDSLNPYRGLNDPSYLLYGLLYDYPFAFDQDGNSIPNLVTSAACVTPACTAWNYTVRQGVFWSDGTPLTANDVNFTFNYDSQNLFHLWAFEPYFNQVVQCNPPKQIYNCGAASYPKTPWNVTVYFKHPFAAGEDLYAPIVQAAQWSGVSPSAAETSYTNSNPIGTGPFIADPNIYNEFLNMPTVPLHVYKNPRYHPLQGTAVPTVNITDMYLWVYNDPTTLVQALNNGAIQLAQLPSSAYGLATGPVITQVGLQAIQEWDEIGISQINSTKLNPVRLDTSFRQALAMATNKDYILKYEYDGFGQRGDSLISPIVPWWYDPTVGVNGLPPDNLTFNIQQANAILNQSGYTTWSGGSFGNGVREATANHQVSYQPPCYQCLSPPNATVTIPAGTPLTFTLAVRPVNEFPEEYATAQYLEAQWAEIGVGITIKQETTESALSTDVYGGKIEMYIWYWSSDQDPNYMLSMESSWTLDGWNDNYWNNGSYNQLYIKQLGDLNYDQRLIDVKMAQRIQYEQASYIIYIYPYGVWSMRYDVWTNWGNWVAHPYRQMNAYWGANPLWFDLACPNCTSTGPTNTPPTPPVISPGGTITVYANDTTPFSATSQDPETYDTLNWTWTWGDSSPLSYTNNTPNPTGTVTVQNSHAWNRSGTFYVSVTVSDGAPGNYPVPTQNPVTVNVKYRPPPSVAGWINGTVKDPGGTGIAGANVKAEPTGLTAVTGTTGTYSLYLVAGTYNVTANKTLYSANTTNGIVVTVGHTTVVNFTLVENAGWIAGTVTNSNSNAPIAGALVKVYRGASLVQQKAADSAGAFNFSVEPATYAVNVTATGYYGQQFNSVAVGPGATQTLTVKLNPVPQVSGGLDTLLIVGIAAIVIIVVAAVLVVFLMRRRTAKEKEEGKVELPPKNP